MAHEEPVAGTGRRTSMIVLVRAMHALITAFFLSCLAVLLYHGVTGDLQLLAGAAAIALAVESAVVLLNGGDCPLGGVHRRYGDDKTFFELFLPKRAAKLAVPVLGGVMAVGIVLLVVRAMS